MVIRTERPKALGILQLLLGATVGAGVTTLLCYGRRVMGIPLATLGRGI